LVRVQDRAALLAGCDPEALNVVDDLLVAILIVQHDRRARGTLLVLAQAAADVPGCSAMWAHEEG
jgi:hypothetical protein